MIEEINLKGIDINIAYKKKPEPTSNNPDLCEFFFRFGSIAQSNSGKTYSICSFIQQYEKYGVKDCDGTDMEIKTIWCSPTSNYASNSIIKTLKSLHKDDIYEDVNKTVLKEIFENIKREKEEIKKKIEYTAAYKRFLKVKENKLTLPEVLILSEYDFEPPNEVFKNLKNYMYIWCLDDIIGQQNSVVLE